MVIQNNSQLNQKARICAIYGRVSDDDAANVLHGSLEQQAHMGRAVAKQLSESTGIPHIVKYVLIEEKAISGGTTNRPKYQQLLDLIRAQRIDVIIAKEISRVNRSTKDFCTFMELCQRNSVSVQIKGLDIDPSTPMGKAMFQLLAVVAELEREMIRDRTRSGIRSAAINNGKINGSQVLLGFDRHPDKAGFRIPNQKELDDVLFLMRTFNQKLHWNQTLKEAKKAGIKTKYGSEFRKDTLIRLLSNRKYIGKLDVKTDTGVVTVDLPYGQVVPADLFDLVQRNIAELEKKSRRKEKERVYILTGLLKHEDGSTFSGFSGTGRTKRYYYYRNTKHKTWLTAEEVEEATISYLRIFENNEKLVKKVNEIQKTQHSRLDFLKSKINQHETELQQLEKEDAGLVQKLLSMDDSDSIRKWLSGKLREIEARRATINDELIFLKKDVDSLKSKIVDELSIKRSLKVLFDGLRKAAPDVQAAFLQTFCRELTVHTDGRVKVKWRFPIFPKDGDMDQGLCDSQDVGLFKGRTGVASGI